MHTGRLEGPHWSAVGDKPTGRYAKRLERYAKERAEREAKVEPVAEAYALKKRVKIVGAPAPHAWIGKYGWIGEIRYGLHNKSPKMYTIDLDHGGGSIMLPREALRLVKDEMGEAMEREPQYADPDFSKPMFGEGDNPQDEITMDVPLLIRLLEYAREDAKTDMDLHNVAEQLIKLSGQGCLSMEQYEQIVGSMHEAKAPRKGTVAYNAAMQRKKQDNSPEAIKRTEKIGNQNHQVGNVKVIHKETAPGRGAYAGRKDVPGMTT
jgi:hypothetical protein